MRKSVLYSALGLAAGVTAYIKLLRPYLRSWGASLQELHQPMPGDEIVENPSYTTTRAITIDTSTSAVWPWLVQMGEQRGGFYSFDFIDRLLGMKVHSAHRILPRFQELNEGDVLTNNGDMVVRHVEQDEAIVIGRSQEAQERDGIEATWTIAIYPIDDDQTRLISRVRANFHVTNPRALFWLAILDPGHLIMEQKFLREIKLHAEGKGEKWPPETSYTIH